MSEEVKLHDFTDEQLFAYAEFGYWLRLLPPRALVRYVKKLSYKEKLATDINRVLLVEIANGLYRYRRIDSVGTLFWWSNRVGFFKGRLMEQVRYYTMRQEYMKARVAYLWLHIVEELESRLGHLIDKLMWR